MGAHQSQEDGGAPTGTPEQPTSAVTAAATATPAVGSTDAPAAATHAAAPPRRADSREQDGADEVTLIQPMEAVVQERVVPTQPKSCPTSPSAAHMGLTSSSSSSRPDSPRGLLSAGPSVKVVNMGSMAAPRLSASEVDECEEVPHAQRARLDSEAQVGVPAVRQFVA